MLLICSDTTAKFIHYFSALKQPRGNGLVDSSVSTSVTAFVLLVSNSVLAM